MKRIKSLREISPNVWKATYLDNDGTYEIEVFMNENYGKSSCGCHTYFYPCRHINQVTRIILRKRKKKKLLEWIKKLLG